jgi:hypothetical protein
MTENPGDPSDAPQRRPGFRRGLGIAFGVYGAIAVLLVVFSVGDIWLHPDSESYTGLAAAFGFSVLFLIASLVLLIVGVSLGVTRKDSGIGAGLLLGWGLGLVIVPMLTFGACLGLLNAIGG